jgi:hypothetical protein
MGDKTQLLALVLAARFRKPWPIVLGILVATLANHGLAGALGAWVTTVVGPQMLRWILGASFIAMAVWMLIPDKLDEGDADGKPALGRVRHHAGGLLPGRDGRQDADCHRHAGRAIQRLPVGGGRHHAGHDAGQCARGVAGRQASRARCPFARCIGDLGGDLPGAGPAGHFAPVDQSG